MSAIRYSLFLALALSIAACGVRRDLTLDPKHSGHDNDTQPASGSGSVLD